MKRFLLPGVALALVLLVAFAPGPASRYEYRFVRLRDDPAASGPTPEQVTNTFGRDGWELDQVDTTWVFTMNDEHASVLLVFRRPR